MHRGQSITDLETVAAAEKYVCVSRPGQRWAAKTLRSSVSQHSRHSANSAFIPYPGNWVLLPPYSEPPLQLTDKSTLCWSMMDGWTVEEGRGHTLSLHCSGERLRPFVTLLSFNNISDLIPSEGWQVPGTTLSVHSCVSSCLRRLSFGLSTVSIICSRTMASNLQSNNCRLVCVCARGDIHEGPAQPAW